MLWIPEKIDSPPPIHPNKIQAMYMQMANQGQFFIGQIGAPALSISEWRNRELERWKRHTELHT